METIKATETISLRLEVTDPDMVAELNAGVVVRPPESQVAPSDQIEAIAA